MNPWRDELTEVAHHIEALKFVAGLVAGHEAYSYTLGSIPLHPCGPAAYSEWQTWETLTYLEKQVRDSKGLPHPITSWGGRDAVGGSGWNDPSILNPEEIIELLD